MNSSNRPLPLPDEEVIERELPDEYQVVFQSQTPWFRRATLMLIIGFLLLLSAGVLVNALGEMLASTRAPYWLERLSGLPVLPTFAAMIAYFFRDELLRYEVLAIGQGSIVVVRKYDLFQRVKWAAFDPSRLELADIADGFAYLSHPVVGKFANNTPKTDLVEILHAIRNAVNSTKSENETS